MERGRFLLMFYIVVIVFGGKNNGTFNRDIETVPSYVP
jgi:hypothetical protein